MIALLGAQLVVVSPGGYRRQLARLATFRRRGRVPKGVSRIVRAYHDGGSWLALPRGLLPQVQALGRVQVVDKRLLLPPVDFNWRATLREEQKGPALQLAKAGGGVLLGGTGTGKTITSFAIAAAWRQPTLWLTHRKALARQAMRVARSCFNLPPRAFGMIGAGVKDDFGSVLTIAMVQSLSRLAPSVWKRHRYAERFGCVIVEEAHHSPAITFQGVVNRFPAARRLAQTGSPERADGLGGLMMAMFGPTVATIDARAAVARGHILLPRVRVVSSPLRHYGTGAWAEVQRDRARDPGRNVLVGSLAASEWKRGRRVLVMVDLRTHGALLARLLSRRLGVPAEAVDGSTIGAVRDRAFAACERGASVLVATDIVQEGVDLPSVDCLILASSARGIAFRQGDREVVQPRLQQQLGRIMRAVEGKTDAVVYDIADPGVRSLARQARQRLRAYQQLGLRVQRQ